MRIKYSGFNLACVCGLFAVLSMCGTATVSAATGEHVIDRGVLDRWSAPYRGWEYYGDHVIAAQPKIEGFEPLPHAKLTALQSETSTPSTESRLGFRG